MLSHSPLFLHMCFLLSFILNTIEFFYAVCSCFPNFCRSVIAFFPSYGHSKFSYMVDLNQSFESELNQALQKISLTGRVKMIHSQSFDLGILSHRLTVVSQPARSPQSILARVLHNIFTLSSKSHCINLPFPYAAT